MSLYKVYNVAVPLNRRDFKSYRFYTGVKCVMCLGSQSTDHGYLILEVSPDIVHKEAN